MRPEVLVELKQLRLYGMAGAWSDLVDQGQPLDTAQWLIEHLLQAEHTDRAMRSVRHQLTLARFPLHRDLAGFDFEGTPIDHDLIDRLADALQMAVTQRQPRGVIHHSDRESQYTGYAFGKRCREAGIMPSMGSVGDAYDNAMAESFFATLEREVLNRRRFKSQAEARMAIFEWIEGWYNPHRRHSGLGYRSPANYERAHLQARSRLAELPRPSATAPVSSKIREAA